MPPRTLHPLLLLDFMPAPRLLLPFVCCFAVSSLKAQTDDFDDNNDSGWTKLDQIGAALGGTHATIAVEAGQYHLSCPSSPAPSQVGPARAGAYRADNLLTDFVVVVDVVSWDDSLDQAMGILSRIQANPGPGTLKGYSLNYQARDHDIEINRLDNEQPVLLTKMPLSLAPGEPHRFVFTGKAGELSAAVFSLGQPLLPMVTLSATDETYLSGAGGIFIYNADSGGVGPADVTFDNYAASAPATPELTLSPATAGSGITVSWPRAFPDWHLQFSSDLNVWADVTTDGVLTSQTFSHTTSLPAENRSQGFYRLKQGWAEPR